MPKKQSINNTIEILIMGIQDLFPEANAIIFDGESVLGEIPDWESMAAVNLQYFIDEAFRVPIPLDILNEKATISDIVKYIDDIKSSKSIRN